MLLVQVLGYLIGIHEVLISSWVECIGLHGVRGWG